MKNKIVLSMCLIICAHNQAIGQALHWLSKPESQLGQVKNGEQIDAQISANGRYVSFTSIASNHVHNDTNETIDLFVYDTVNGTTQLASVAASGNQNDSTVVGRFSAPTSDGNWVAFVGNGDFGFSETGTHIYLKNLPTGQLQMISNGLNSNGLSTNLSIHLADDANNLIFLTRESLDPVHSDPNYNLYLKDLNNNTYTLLSPSADGTTAADRSIADFDVSPNGRYVAMNSDADNLVSSPVSGFNNVFLLDNNSATIQLVTVQPSGDPSTSFNFSSFPMSVSNSGQVAYIAYNDDLVAGDTNDRFDVFLFDGSINTRINLDANGQEATELNFWGAQRPLIDASGTRVVFAEEVQLLSADQNDVSDIYSYTIQTGTMNLITMPNDLSQANLATRTIGTALSADGNRLIMLSELNQSNNSDAIYHNSLFQYEFNNQQTSQINPVAFSPNTVTEDVTAPKISSNQQWTVYASATPNLTADVEPDRYIDLFLLNRETDSHKKIGSQIITNAFNAYNMSPSGRYVVFQSNYFQPAGDIDLLDSHVFLYDQVADQYTQVAVGISAAVNDAGMVIFSTAVGLSANDTNNFFDAYLYDPSDNSLSLVSENTSGMAANGATVIVGISGSATEQWLMFSSSASDLVASDQNNFTDVFVRSWPGGTTQRISQTPGFEGGNEQSFGLDISYEGDFVAMFSNATNLTNDDYSNSFAFQAFIHDRNNQLTQLASRDNSGQMPDSGAAGVAISDSGRYLAYSSNDSILTEDTDSEQDVYLFDSQLETTTLVSKNLDNQQSSQRFTNVDIAEDLMVTPPLLGVAFNGGSDFTNVTNHPGYDEAFLYQQGGPNVELSIEVLGLGSVNGSQGITCISDCQYNYPLGTELVLVASPENGYVFDRWLSSRGQCTDNTNPCSLTMNRDKQTQAIFINENDIIYKAGFE